MTDEVFGQYRLMSLLGRGGMGEVYRAFDTIRCREVAIKRLPAQLAADQEYVTRFRYESALVARLREPHIIPVHDYGEINGWLFIDMRLVEGPDLAALLDREGPLGPRRAVNMISHIAAALDAAHSEGLVHRDVKPGNILITSGSGGDSEFAYVADFGIARAVSGSPHLTMAGAALGSPAYMAPERFDQRCDHRADVYSLGCLLFETLTGRRPFTGDAWQLMSAHLKSPPPRPSLVVPGLPAGIDAVVARAMAKNPDQRYQSAGAVAAAARAVLEGDPGATIPPIHEAPPTWEPPPSHEPAPVLPDSAPPRAPRRNGLVLAAVAAVIATLAGATLALTLGGPADPPSITRAPGNTPGDNPFTPPLDKDRTGIAPPAGSAGVFAGDTLGLYGGTMSSAACNPATLIAFLQRNPDREATWGEVQGVATADVPDYIAGSTPAFLRTDTVVTNHGFANGRATTVPSVLQAGTAVLVDKSGVPRARCYSGSPLTPPQRIEDPQYVGPTWSGFSAAAVTTIAPASSFISEFTLVDPATDTVFVRPRGSAGELDRPQHP